MSMALLIPLPFCIGVPAATFYESRFIRSPQAGLDTGIWTIQLKTSFYLLLHGSLIIHEEWPV